MSEQASIKLSTDPATGVSELVLTRPSRLNAIDAEMAGRLHAALDAVAGDAGTWVLLVRGEGRAFCAGGDVSAFDGTWPHAEVALATMDRFHPAILRLATLPFVTLAHVHGAVAGAGLGLMLACDLAYAAPETRFTTAYARLAASPDGATSFFLPRAVGVRKAMELALLSEPLGVDEAERLGLVNAVGDVDGARAIARRLASGAPAAQAAIKRLVRPLDAAIFAAHLDSERATFAELAARLDFSEGLAALRERRTPSFTGTAAQ